MQVPYSTAQRVQVSPEAGLVTVVGEVLVVGALVVGALVVGVFVVGVLAVGVLTGVLAVGVLAEDAGVPTGSMTLTDLVPSIWAESVEAVSPPPPPPHAASKTAMHALDRAEAEGR